LASRTQPRPRFPRSTNSEVVAGVDLGSNSFHLIVARAEDDGRIHVLDRLRDPVRLAAGLDAQGLLTSDATARGVTALERFGERLRDMSSRDVRAVGTNTLRKARNGAAVEETFSEALGHPVEIISGHEEARLIYDGVTHVTPEIEGRLLVVDIGGGSTECIIGRGYEPLALDSLYMGCVEATQRFFGDGKVTRDAFHKARLAAGLELASIVARYREIGWDRVLGSSGTILAVSEVLRQQGWASGTITADTLEKLEDLLVAGPSTSKLELAGLEPDRAPVFAGGVAILSAAFLFLEIEEMTPASGALREGLIYELLGRVTAGDPRDRTIDSLASRYKVDRAHTERVAETVAALFSQANEYWKHDTETGLRLLRHAAAVHEIGLSISYAGFHKHGAYILEHADISGFSVDEQQILAAIVGAHRRKFSLPSFDVLPRDRRQLALHLTLLLRLAVRLHRSRTSEALPELRLRARKSQMLLDLPANWLEAHPLTRADLEEEAEILGRAGVTLALVEG